MLSWWLYDQLLLVGTLVLWYVHHFPPLASNHMTIPGLHSTPPLNPSIRPYLSPTYNPPGPYLMPMSMAGDESGSNSHLLVEPDSHSATVCGSADSQVAIISVHERGAWVGPTVGRPSECVLVSDIVYNG